MSFLRILSGLSSNLNSQPLSDGTVYFTTDNSRLYIDRSNGVSVERYLINQTKIKYLNSQDRQDFITEKNTFYVYEDLVGKENAIKIGDGKAYLIDMPFLDEYVMEHINNEEIHITAEERALWNDKVTCFLDSEDMETLIFTKKKGVNKLNG